MKSPYFYLQPNDYIYVKPLKQKTWGTGKTGIESIGTLVSLLSLATTTYFFYLKLKPFHIMLDIKDFSILKTKLVFDFKGFLIKIGSYWKWF
jgi:hypothetical protein